MRLSTLFTFIIFYLIGQNELFAQQYQFTNYSVTDGLAQSQVFAIAQANDGYVWMATQGGGLCRFDGEHFETFSTQQGLASNYIHCLLSVSNDLFIGTSEGLNLISKGKISTLTFPELEISVADLLLLKNGSVAIATNKGLFLYNGSSISKSSFDLTSIGSLYALEIDNVGQLWIGGNTGLMSCSEQSCTEYTLDSGLNIENIRALHCDAFGNVWIGTYGAGVNVFTDQKLLDMNPILGLAQGRIHDISSDLEGNIWFATQQKGLCQFKTATAESVFVTEKNGLANNHVRCIFRDDWNNYWIGTSGGGASKYKGQQFKYITQKQGLAGNYIYSISQDSYGRILIGNSGKGIQMLDSGELKTVPLPASLSKTKVKAILQTQNCDWWYGTDGDGVWVNVADSFYQIHTGNGLKSNYIRSLLEDDDGKIWIATAGGGIHKIEVLDLDTAINFRMESIGAKNGVEADRINALALDQKGRVWFGSLFKGIGVIENDKLKFQFNSANSDVDNNINSLISSTDGSIWAGSVSNGIYRILPVGYEFEIQHFTAPNSLASNIVYQLIMDDEGRLWVGSEKGVERLTLSVSGEPIERKLFNQEDGFLGVETTLNAAFKAEDGALWFGTINGLSSFDDQAKSLQEALPKLKITKATVNAKAFDFSGLSLFTYDSNLIAFEYKAISQSKPKSVRYQVRLLGLNTTWSEASDNKSITYTNLPEGDYTFQVKASTNGVDWTEIESSNFQINPPFWRTKAFIVSMTILSLLLIGFTAIVVYLILKRRMTRRQRQLTIEKEMLMLEQKALRLQMNPHFIFNALNSIQALVSSSDSKTARLYLAKFSKLMRQILDNSRKATIPLENEIAALENYLAIEQFCHNHRFEYEIIIDDNVDSEVIELPPILIQPFVENAIIHGVSQNECLGKISVIFSLKGQYLKCEIKDNGIGRSAAAKQKSQRDQQHKSTALLITQERLDLLNKSADQPSIEIIDLKDENGKPTGTLVQILIAI
jgi:ligand-binding sensor domain-containing protein